MNKKVLVAMSGGIDSSVAALLLNEQGYNCMGATMKLFYNEGVVCSDNSRTCCSLEDVEDARSVAHMLGIPYHVFNFTGNFKEAVIDRFITGYENGTTPNPCIDCNRYLKFDKLLHRASELSFNYVATGHYAKVEYDAGAGRYLLKKARDQWKDQSYVLYFMTQEQLGHTILPLGDLEKSNVRSMAESRGFTNARKRESQDICFVQNKSYAEFIEEQTGRVYAPGNFLDSEGVVLGTHKGIIRYTIGQRKGLGLSLPEPLYVCSLQPEQNTVTLGKSELLYRKTLIARDINLIAVTHLDNVVRLKVKIRYHQPEQWAMVEQIDEDTLYIEFEEPQRSVTRGQAVVLYDGDVVIGGGTIYE